MKQKVSWKDSAKAFALLVGFVFVLNAVSFTFDMWMTFLGGALRGNSDFFKLAFYYGLIFGGVGFAGVAYYAWFHRFSAKVYGLPLVNEHANKLIAENEKLAEAVLEEMEANRSLTKTNDRLSENYRLLLDSYEELLATHLTGETKPRHFDDWALDQFVTQMRATLRRKREDDFGGWNDQATEQDLRLHMIGQANKGAGMGNMVHIANYAMMVWVRDAFPEECKAGQAYPVAK